MYAVDRRNDVKLTAVVCMVLNKELNMAHNYVVAKIRMNKDIEDVPEPNSI